MWFFFSSSIDSRIQDLHTAFLDSEITIILSTIGAFNANQLLSHIDYQVIKMHPTFLCGYSDMTTILNAIYAKTGMIAYLGPHFSSFAMKKG